MSQSRPSLRQALAHSSESSGLLPFASLQTPDSYFKELKKRSSRPKISEQSSDSLAPIPTTPKRSPSPNPRSSSPAVSTYSTESFSNRNSAAADVVDRESLDYPSSPINPQGFNNEVAPTVGDPPRPAKPGYEWVWYPDPYGYWAERPEIPRNSAGRSKGWPKWKRISFTGKASSSSIDKLQSNAERKQSIAERRQSNATRRQSNAARRQSNADRRSSIKALQHDMDASLGSDIVMDDAQASPTQESLQQKLMKGIQFLSPRVNSPIAEGEGFFKSKTGKGKRVYPKHPSSSASEFSVLSRTAALLKGVAEVLEHHHGSDCNKPLADPHQSHHRKGIFNRHKRNSQDSVMSLTDSIRSVLRGKTPVVTPVPEEKYTGSDGRQYLKVNLGTKNAPTYLPSEATRIHTPPLSDETPGVPARGFFFDLSSPENDDTALLSDSSISPPKQVFASSPQARKTGITSRSPTGRTVPESPLTPGTRNRIAKLRAKWENGFQNADVKKAGMSTRPSRFELDVPEHLPSSPLCPMNPMHKSGGTGICVYHGRKKKKSDASNLVDELLRSRVS